MTGDSIDLEDAGPTLPSSPRRRLLAALVVAFVPWTVVFTGPYVDLFFPVGFVSLDPFGLITIVEYYVQFSGVRASFLNAWGLSAILFAVGLGSAFAGVVWREDPRITGAAFAFAGVGQLAFAVGFHRRPGYAALPIGTVLLWTLVWWHYGPALASIFEYPDGSE